MREKEREESKLWKTEEYEEKCENRKLKYKKYRT